jgi:hypothetical protein
MFLFKLNNYLISYTKMILNLSNKNLTSLAGITIASNVAGLILDNNKLTDISGIPSTVHTVSLNNNSTLTNLSSIPEGVVQVFANNCVITSSTIIPSTLTYLHLNNNNITDLLFLNGISIIDLELSSNSITSLQYCPSTVVKLNISSNNLSSFLYLPVSVIELNVSYNSNLTNFIDITESHLVRNLDITGTGITSLTGLNSLCQLIYNNNSNILSDIPNTLVSINKERMYSGKNTTESNIQFSLPSDGYVIKNGTVMRKISTIIVKDNINYSICLVNASIDSGTIEMKLVQINKGVPITILTATLDSTSSNNIYEFNIDSCVNIRSIIELHVTKSSNTSTCTIEYCSIST